MSSLGNYKTYKAINSVIKKLLNSKKGLAVFVLKDGARIVSAETELFEKSIEKQMDCFVGVYNKDAKETVLIEDLTPYFRDLNCD